MGKLQRMVVAALASAIALTTVVAGTAHAEPGDLDSTYGVCGVGPGPGGDVARAQADGQLLVISGGLRTITVVRVSTSGAPDVAYGQGGSSRISLPALTSVTDAAVTSEGKLLVAFSMSGAAHVLRIDTNGHPDLGFGDGGVATVAPGHADKIVVQSDGAPLVLYSDDDTGIHVERLTAAGVVDTSYTFAISYGEPPTFVGVGLAAVAMQPDDKLLIAGSFGHDYIIRRWNSDGSVDPSFFVPGPFPLPGIDRAAQITDMVPTPQGLLVASTREFVTDRKHDPLAIARYDSAGVLDSSFSDDGYVLVTLTDADRHSRLDVDASGMITVLSHGYGVKTGVATGLARLTSAGVLDDSFGSHGVAVLDLTASKGPIGFAVSGNGVLVATSVGVDGDVQHYDRAAIAKLRTDTLKQGAGLILDWTGTLWPTRLGNDPAPECPFDTPYWEDSDLARGVTTVAGKGGYVVDAYGGLHGFSVGGARPTPARTIGGPYWLGWDIVRGVAARADGRAGYVVDGWGGVHPFRTPGNALPATPRNGPYWAGFDIARGMALMPDGTSGYLLDGYGGLHPFSTPGHPLPPAAHGGPYWYGWDIARGVSILPDGTGGYVLDGYGGVHPFSLGNHAAPPPPGPGAPYDTSDDWARGFAFVAPIDAPADAPRSAVPPTAPEAAFDRLRDRPASPPHRSTR